MIRRMIPDDTELDSPELMLVKSEGGYNYYQSRPKNMLPTVVELGKLADSTALSSKDMLKAYKMGYAGPDIRRLLAAGHTLTAWGVWEYAAVVRHPAQSVKVVLHYLDDDGEITSVWALGATRKQALRRAYKHRRMYQTHGALNGRAFLGLAPDIPPVQIVMAL